MVPDLTLEVIYYNQPTDFKMEFELCGCCNVRFLSMSVKERGEFLKAISKSVVRSRAIVVVGSFNPLDNDYLPKVVARATGYIVKPIDKAKYEIITQGDHFLPDTALPLVDSKGCLAGCVLENNDQAIIMLTGDKVLRHRVVSDLVCPYLNFFADKKTGKNSVPEGAIPASVSEENITDEKDTQNKEEFDSEVINTTLIENIDLSDNLVEDSLKNNECADDVMVIQQEKPFVEAYATNDEDDVVSDEEYTPGYTILESPNISLSEQDNQHYMEDSKNNPPKKCRRWLRIVISFILVFAVLFCTYFGYKRVYQPIQSQRVYEDMRELYGQIWEGLPEDMLYKFGCLYQTNPDIYGWLDIPNTNINYPVVTTANKSASYYQNHLFEGSFNSYGTFYTPSTVGEGDYSRNTVIYGKDMPDGTMFSQLEKYLDLEHYRATPSFTFDTLYLELIWKVFSVYRVGEDKLSAFVRTEFFDDNQYEEYLKLIQKVSIIKTNIEVNYKDQIVTLVSKSDGDYIVVAARCVRPSESPLVDITDSILTDYAYDSDAIDAVTVPSDFVEIDPLDGDESSEDKNMVDGSTSRYEQDAVSSTVDVRPNNSVSSNVNVTIPPSSSSVISSTQTTTSKPSSSSVISSSKPQSSSSVIDTPSSNKLPTLTVTNSFTGKKVSGPANEIIAQILEAEMGSSYNIEALKAQSVAAYSWLLCHGAADGKAPTAPMKTAKARCIEAANAVAGQVAVYNGKVATTYYYAISAGRTAFSKDIWYSQLPYLVSVDSSVDKSVSGYQTIRKYSASDVASWAKELLGVDLNEIDKSEWFKCTYDANGVYVTQVKIGGVAKKGTYLRDSFFTSARVGASNVLRSSSYTITYSQSEDKFVFTVKGYGHGVGMSQAGANVYAKKGWDYQRILKHYYTGVSLGTYYVD